MSIRYAHIVPILLNHLAHPFEDLRARRLGRILHHRNAVLLNHLLEPFSLRDQGIHDLHTRDILILDEFLEGRHSDSLKETFQLTAFLSQRAVVAEAKSSVPALAL